MTGDTGNEVTWQDRLTNARAAGLLAREFFVVHSDPAGDLDKVRKCLKQHITFQKEIERAGNLFAAGPLSDETGTQWTGRGLIILRAENLAAAHAIAKADPMHSSGARTYTLLPWMMNEGKFTLDITLSEKSVSFS
jgi:uncharacterized protein YciI